MKKPTKSGGAAQGTSAEGSAPAAATSQIEPNEKAADPAITAAQEKLAPFLAEHPRVKIEQVQSKDATIVRLTHTWDDPSFAIRVPEESDNFVEALNQVRLPTRLSALWHKDTGDLEIIWSAHNLPKSQREVIGRHFRFVFKGRAHDCEFGQASSRLLAIAEHMQPITLSPTSWRNLQSFSQFARIPKERHPGFGLDEPRSFWIRDVKFKEDGILELVENLNFYLTYYDYRSPIILVHGPADPNEQAVQRTRYLHGDFPEEITGDGLDSHLLSFWNSAYDERPMMSFLLYFRIIEYAATHYVDDAARVELRKLLMAPNLRGNVGAAVERIVGSLNITKLDDTQRFKAVLRQCVNPSLLWADIQPNVSFFSKDTKFDGGFTVKPLVSADEKESTFRPRGVDSFADSARKIRNALSHGKDQETAGVITPTTRNVKLFQPWIHLLATAAGEVVLYKDAH